jgi:hypothetical protein
MSFSPIRRFYPVIAICRSAKLRCQNAGEGIDLLHAVEPASDIVAPIVAEAEAALNQRFV